MKCLIIRYVGNSEWKNARLSMFENGIPVELSQFEMHIIITIKTLSIHVYS
jgi:hypothetical protein